MTPAVFIEVGFAHQLETITALKPEEDLIGLYQPRNAQRENQIVGDLLYVASVK